MNKTIFAELYARDFTEEKQFPFWFLTWEELI